jgi:hypothetical protein
MCPRRTLKTFAQQPHVFPRLAQRLTVRCVVAAAYINLPNVVFCLLLPITPASFNPKFLKSRTHELLSPPESPIAQLHVVESFSRSSLYISTEFIATKRTNALVIMFPSSKSHQKRMDGENLEQQNLCPVVRSLVRSGGIYKLPQCDPNLCLKLLCFEFEKRDYWESMTCSFQH